MATTQDETQAGTRLKRRGLIAGAAALVVGIAAAKTSPPVAASGGYVQNNFTASGAVAADVGFDASASEFTTGVTGVGSTYGVSGNGNSYGVTGFGNSDGY